MSNEQLTALTNFKRCVEDAPEGTYEDAKKLNEVIGDAVDKLMRDIRALGLNADACDGAFALEAALYSYVKQFNRDCALFPMAEDFGVAMDGPGGRDFVRGQAFPIYANGQMVHQSTD